MLPIRPMMDPRRRVTTATKRRLGLLKKAAELSILAAGDVDILTIIRMKDSRGPPRVVELNSMWSGNGSAAEAIEARRTFLKMVGNSPASSMEFLCLGDYTTLVKSRYMLPIIHPMETMELEEPHRTYVQPEPEVVPELPAEAPRFYHGHFDTVNSHFLNMFRLPIIKCRNG